MSKLEFIFVALIFFCAGAYFHKGVGKVASYMSQAVK